MIMKMNQLILMFTVAILAYPSFSNAEDMKKTERMDRHYTGFYSWIEPEWKTGILKIFLRNKADIERKKRFWKNIKKRHDAGLYSHYIYIIYFEKDKKKKRKYKIPSWDKARKMLDEFFTSTPECPTYPDYLFAVCPPEENITWGGQIQLQNKVHDYLSDKYKLKVYQWLSDPLGPRLDIKADGWILDAYSLKGEKFYRHLNKFLLYGKPVVPIIWAAEPGLDNYFKDGGLNAIFKATEVKFDYCRELNLPVVLFACSKKLGSVNIWMHSKKSPFPELREFFFAQLKKLSSNDVIAAPHHVVPVYECCGDKQNRFAQEIKFNRFDFVNYCLIDNVHNLHLDKTGLHYRGGDNDKTTLKWCFEASTSFIKSNVILSYHKKDMKDIKLEYSKDCKVWQIAQEEDSKFNLKTDKDSKIYLRITLRGGQALLRNMRFNAELTPVVIKPVTLKRQDNHWFFEENFETNKFIHYMTYEPSEQLLIKKGHIGIEGRKGYGVTWSATQKIEVPQAVSKVSLIANCYADKRNRGGVVKIGISADGKNIIKEQKTFSRKTKNKRFLLETEVSFPQKTKSFYIHLTLKNGSGIYVKNRSAANIYNYKIIAN